MSTQKPSRPLDSHATSERPKRPRRLPEPTRHDLLRLCSAAPTYCTKKAARELIRGAGLRPSPSAVLEYLAIETHIDEQRANRVERHFEKRFGANPAKSSQLRKQPQPSSPGDVRARLKARRVGAVSEVARSTFRSGAAGGTSLQVAFANASSDVQYEVLIRSNRTTYRGAFKGWSAIEDHHRICVPEDWRLRVQRRGLAVLGGLMTLDLHALPAPEGVQLYAAVWAAQGRGYLVSTHRGYIAIRDAEHYHADSLDSALKGLSRRLKARGKPSFVRSMQLDVDGFVMRFEKHKTVAVSLDHARATGACEYGIRSWCAAVGIDPDDYEVPMAVALEGFRKRPQVEVRRAIIEAVREHRAARGKRA